MRRLALVVLCAACAVVFGGARVTAARASDTCTSSIATPTIGDGHIDDPGSNASCTPDSWFTIVVPDYESGGVWHPAPNCKGSFWSAGGFGSAFCDDRNPPLNGLCGGTFNSGSNTFDDYWDSSDTASCKNAEDVIQADLPGNNELCFFNWKIDVQLFDTGSGFIRHAYSAEVAKTCS